MRRCSVLTTGRLTTDHIAALEGLHSPVTIDRRCADLTELIAAAQVQRADAALIIGQTEQLTTSVIAQLASRELTLVAVSDVAAERGRLKALGFTVFDDDVAGQDLAEALQGPPGQPVASSPFTANSTAGHSSPEEGTPSWALEETATSESPETRLTGITGVWGTSGAPGRTTTAVNIAAELALSGASTLLIDADTYAASAAIHLGLMQESAGVAQACRSAELGSLDVQSLTGVATSVNIGHHVLHVLTGLPRADRWAELRSQALDRVLHVARRAYDCVVVDTASPIEQDADLAFDTQAPQRNSSTATVLSQADRIFALGSADPVGFARLVKSVEELQEAIPESTVPAPVVTGVRRDVVGRSPHRQLAEAWDQLGPSVGINFYLPWDRAACDQALRTGEVLAEAAEHSELRRQIAALAGIELPQKRRFFRSPRRARRPRQKVATAQ